jgi:hypothetical protein
MLNCCIYILRQFSDSFHETKVSVSKLDGFKVAKKGFALIYLAFIVVARFTSCRIWPAVVTSAAAVSPLTDRSVRPDAWTRHPDA